MPKVTKTCRVCGKEYEACRTVQSNPLVFRWQDVSCSPECGSIYLARVKASRSGAKTDTPSSVVEERKYVVDFVDDDIDYDDIERELNDYFGEDGSN